MFQKNVTRYSFTVKTFANTVKFMDKNTCIVSHLLQYVSACLDASCVLLQDVADPLFAHCRLHADKRTTASRVIHCVSQLSYTLPGEIIKILTGHPS